MYALEDIVRFNERKADPTQEPTKNLDNAVPAEDQVNYEIAMPVMAAAIATSVMA
jgi:hypothetical protein